jgi:ABC-type antimicrobial peptide transport system permease subunit
MSKPLSIWQKLISDKRAVFGLSVIALAAFISISGAYLRPDATKNANDQQLA